jgi:(p)ppGpp synthase/HD superfamily hydrolase
MNREEYFRAIADRLHGDELAYVQRAYWLVKEAHRKQSRRLTGERFFEHVRRVSFLAGVTYGYYDAQTLSLGLLHDLIEDTYVPSSVIVSLFGQTMYAEVLLLSKELPSYNVVTGEVMAKAKLTDKAYYGALAIAPQRPRVVKGCDRLDNLSDLERWEPERREKYIKETRELVLPVISDERIHRAIVDRLDGQVSQPH